MNKSKQKNKKQEEDKSNPVVQNSLEDNLGYLEQLKLFCLHFYKKVNKLENNSKSLTLFQNCEKVIDQLQTNFKEIFFQLSQNKTKRLRILADFENYKNHLQKEKENDFKYANQHLITNLLPILDNFHRALSYQNPTKEVKNFLTGFKMVINHFENVLKENGIEEIKTKINDNFNHDIHEGIEVIETKKYKPNKIVKIIQKGYFLNKRVIRPVKVALAKDIENNNNNKKIKETNKNG